MKSDKPLKDAALLLARVAVGASIAAHGAQKMFGLFGGPGLGDAGKFMHSLGFRPGEKYAKLSAGTEIAAGALIATGTLGPTGPAMLASVMLVAAETVHRKNGYFQSKNGFELKAVYVALALLLATEGNGAYALDHALGLDKYMRPTAGWLFFAGGIFGAFAMLSRREIAPPSVPTIRVETGTTEPAPSGA
ncbi:MAG: hypothetical protein NVS9B12_01480 [Vulcanimicrobiaceae bacterium]